MFTYDLSIFLTSTAFESANARIRHTFFEICRILENCPLGCNPIATAFCFYSVLSAITGSFLAATREGIRPAISVRAILIITRMIAPTTGRVALSVARPVREKRIIFIIMLRRSVDKIPIAPAAKPTISVSALNTREISFFDAPIARRIPISLVLSRTEM